VPSRTADDFDRAVAAYVRATASAKRISATKIAEDIGVPLNTFYRYWRGHRTMGLGDLRAIFNVLGVSFTDAEAEITRIFESGEYPD
jgi:transcriptional regulator with XRE-family HTH domain